ncbi:MAG: hypothetical protein [Circular genetic element sp.]|nr:MAG: hypothetical protein [Circular genetic element sp.]
MPINEIRDTIQGTLTTTAGGVGYMTRCINLKDGFKNQVLSIDVFNDNGGQWLSNDIAGVLPAGYQLYVSPFPMQLTNEGFGVSMQDTLPNGGAMAGDEQVLYKEMSTTRLTENNSQQKDKLWYSRFPNPALAATPTTTWFSPHLYITILVWNQAETDVKVNFSLFMRVKQTKANFTTASMGQYKEFLDSQSRLLTDTAVVYDPADVAGYTFPMWRHGGIRPELMISGATALRYFNRVAANANQAMTTQTALQTAYQEATGMVAFDAAFGDPALNLPEWITLMDVSGVTSGLIRPYAPPLKYADNGNTLMF